METQESKAPDSLPAIAVLPYPKPVTIGLNDGTQLPGEVQLVATLNAPVTRIHLGEEVSTGDFHYAVYEAVVADGQVLKFLRYLGGGIINPHVSH